MNNSASYLSAANRIAQSISLVMIVVLAIGAVVATLLSALGVIPWLSLNTSIGSEGWPYTGVAVQLVGTAILIGLCSFLPSSSRVMRLENSHRSFQVRMDDVAQAYAQAHQADRDGTFNLSSEFDSIRDRIAYLRQHPDLREMEPELLELAAQMSQESRELADIYSAKNVERARTFLKQRQEEAEAYAENINLAVQHSETLRQRISDVEAAERANDSQILLLAADLQEILPLIGGHIGQDENGENNVFQISNNTSPSSDRPSRRR